jgi:D-amino-acid dehydrogenase
MIVAIIGGGVVGLCCAHRLVGQGAKVVLLERDRCGGGASLGNAGWITPVLSAPLPAPGVLRQAARWMLDPESPLFIRPRLSPELARWCWQFARNTTRSRFLRGMRALIELNRKTLELFDELRESGVEFEMHREGLLIVSLQEDALLDEWRLIGEMKALGYNGRAEILSSGEVRKLEPALGRNVAGGIYAADERHVRPESLTGGLVRWLRNAGVSIREGWAVERLRTSGHGWSIEGNGERVHVDRVVIAAGVWTRQLLRQLGVPIPLEAAKGYSVTTERERPQLRIPVMLHEAKVGCSPFEGSFRLAGTLELAGDDLALNPRRVGAIVKAASQYLEGYRPSSAAAAWAGLRPVLPDGLPVIGPIPSVEGAFVAAGHGMLGITLAPSTADQLAPLVLERRGSSELAPFRVDRNFS